MKKKFPVYAMCIVAAFSISACSDSFSNEEPIKEAPERDPIALDPNPPMTASDIDAIVSGSRGDAAASETRSTGGEGKQER